MRGREVGRERRGTTLTNKTGHAVANLDLLIF